MFLHFANMIKELREEKGLTQRQLAEIIGLTSNAVYEWEKRGKQPNFETLCKLADFFNVSIDYLLGREL